MNNTQGSIMAEKIQEQLLDFLTRNFLVSREEIILDESLIDQGIIDSFGLIEIATFMEKSFAIVVTEKQMTRQNFGSVLKIVNFIRTETDK
jgi:acyl carrier protein